MEEILNNEIENTIEINDIDDTIDVIETQVVEKKKRGRKPSKDKKSKYYFSDAEEEAVLQYLNSDDAEEKNRLYNTVLRPVFGKMVESIMRRYHLYVPCEESGDTYNDTISFLLTKADKFDKGRNKKAYSYYGNICKNYIIGKIQNYNKVTARNPSYDSVESEYDLSNNIQYSVKQDSGSKIASEVVARLMDRINHMMENPKNFDLKESEIKLGKALINLLDNWDYVISTDGSTKLNKNAILLFLRENTGLDTKGIRDNLKKYKKEFLIIKNYVIS